MPKYHVLQDRGRHVTRISWKSIVPNFHWSRPLIELHIHVLPAPAPWHFFSSQTIVRGNGQVNYDLSMLRGQAGKSHKRWRTNAKFRKSSHQRISIILIINLSLPWCELLWYRQYKLQIGVLICTERSSGPLPYSSQSQVQRMGWPS